MTEHAKSSPALRLNFLGVGTDLPAATAEGQPGFSLSALPADAPETQALAAAFAELARALQSTVLGKIISVRVELSGNPNEIHYEAKQRVVDAARCTSSENAWSETLRAGADTPVGKALKHLQDCAKALASREAPAVISAEAATRNEARDAELRAAFPGASLRIANSTSAQQQTPRFLIACFG